MKKKTYLCTLNKSICTDLKKVNIEKIIYKK